MNNVICENCGGILANLVKEVTSWDFGGWTFATDLLHKKCVICPCSYIVDGSVSMRRFEHSVARALLDSEITTDRAFRFLVGVLPLSEHAVYFAKNCLSLNDATLVESLKRRVREHTFATKLFELRRVAIGPVEAKSDTAEVRRLLGGEPVNEKKYTARDAVNELLKSMPSDVELDITADQMEQMLLSVMGDGQLVPMKDAARYFPTPAELVARGRGALTIREAAEVIGIDEQAVEHAVRVGKLRARAIGKLSTFLIEADSVQSYLKTGGEVLDEFDTSLLDCRLPASEAPQPSLEEMAVSVLRSIQDEIYSRETEVPDEDDEQADEGKGGAVRTRKGIVWQDGDDPTFTLTGDWGPGSATIFRGTMDKPLAQHTHVGNMVGRDKPEENFLSFVRGLYRHFQGQGLSWDIPDSEVSIVETTDQSNPDKDL